MPEQYARRIELEMIGLKPYSGNWVTDGSPDRLPPDGALKNISYTVSTEQGQGREWGYVSDYGEMQGTVSSRAQYFDHAPRMKKRILKQAHNVLDGRTYFRYPHWNGKGKRTVRTEGVIGTRYALYPGKVRHIKIGTVSHMPGDDLALKLLHRRAMEGRLFNQDYEWLGALEGYRYYEQWLNEHKGVPPRS